MIYQDVTLDPRQSAYWLIFSQDRILQHQHSPNLLQRSWSQLEFVHAYRQQIIRVGEHQGAPCFMIDMGSEVVEGDGWQTVSLRALIMQMDTDVLEIAARAWQVALFMRTHRYCGQCGSTMQQVKWEMATQCHRCQHRCYPRISPCIIVAVRDNDSILLAQGAAHKSRQMYSTLAGFVESGESLEQAVHREVFEEVGVKIHNLEYFGSQPWPFPHSLMMGFLADYHSGDLRVDGKEILDANWYRIDELPVTPPVVSIAGQLIAETVRRIRHK